MNNLPPPLPGTGYEAQDFNDMRKSNRSLQPMQSKGNLVTHGSLGATILPARPFPRWQPGVMLPSPHDYNHQRSYPGGSLVYVQPADTMVTDGTTDPDTMATVYATAGWWMSLRPVSPKVIGGTTYYYIPHLPMPTDGDMDAANNYWTQIGGSPGGGSSFFKITDTFATVRDYFTAVEMNSDGTFSGTTTYIAKHYKDRPSITATTIQGSAVTYAYTDNFNRKTTIGANDQLEQLFSMPETNQIIVCVKLDFADPNITVTETDAHSCTWVDMTPRVWARKKDQTGA